MQNTNDDGKVGGEGGGMKMSVRRSTVLAVGVLTAVCLTAGVGAKGQSHGKYHAAGLGQASEIAYPMNASAPGIVTLDASVDGSGTVQNVSVVRDVPPFTNAAVSAVKTWQFTPALVEGQGVPGVVRVNVAFNPYNPSGVGLPGETFQPVAGNAVGNFVPAGVTKAHYANYPPNTVASGTVVLQVHVGHEGKVHGAVVVRGKGGLTGAATAAAKTWVFTPGTYEGKNVSSDVVVGFVFASPQMGTR